MLLKVLDKIYRDKSFYLRCWSLSSLFFIAIIFSYRGLAVPAKEPAP